jgi:predicted transcriptional regulator
MEKHLLSQSEWQIMQLLWQQPHTLMELVSKLSASIGWSKSTVATMVRRMEGSVMVTN